MRILWLAQTLREAGLRVQEVSGWETRGRDGPRRFVPSGVIWHHTATGPSLPTSRLLRLLIDGRADLAGPLAQLCLERDGTYYVICSGKANHAGRGGWLDMDSNYDVVGIEPANDGRGEPWPDVQLDAYRRGTRVILDKLERDAGRMCAHREWAPKRKIDPFGLDMNLERRLVASIGEMRIVQGESGHYVRPFQQALNSWAVKQSVPGWTPLVEDGIYGPDTTAAVTRYQVAAQLNRKPEMLMP